ncbi:MAG: ABC transporter ATP-binding protein [Promethearchaeota archaeon]
METVIETEKLSKIYDHKKVVNDLNIHVNKGELLSLLGPNGAGKTTIIKMLTTILKPDEGTAFVNGFNIKKEKKKIRKTIGVCPQELVFYEQLSALENMIFFGRMFNIKKDILVKRAEDILRTLGLFDRKDKVKNFSGGMKRRLNFAISYIMNPEILFLDEPSAGLDPQSKRIVYNYIEKLKEEGKTILLTTHDMHEAELLSDRVLIIDNGKIIAEGTPDELKEKYGKKNIVEITFKETKLIESIKQKLNSLDFIEEIKDVNETEIMIYFQGGIKNFIKILNQEIIQDLDFIENINLRQNTLEDIFLILTGRRLRD